MRKKSSLVIILCVLVYTLWTVSNFEAITQQRDRSSPRNGYLWLGIKFAANVQKFKLHFASNQLEKWYSLAVLQDSKSEWLWFCKHWCQMHLKSLSCFMECECRESNVSKLIGIFILRVVFKRTWSWSNKLYVISSHLRGFNHIPKGV